MRWIIELPRLLSGGWITLRYIYRRTVDTEFFTRKIGEAKSWLPGLCPVQGVIANRHAHKEPSGDWAWEPVPGTEKAA